MKNKNQIFNAVSGIYSIHNSVRDKTYIGHSKNIFARWHAHMSLLLIDNHHNKELQNDFNSYGFTSFSFNVLELVDGKNAMLVREQQFINLAGIHNLYNSYNPHIVSMVSDVEGFVEYINDNYLLPANSTDKEIRKYKIYGDDARRRIVKKAKEYNIIENIYVGYVTFNRVMRYMQRRLGYSIATGRIVDAQELYTYKLITHYDEKYNLDLLTNK